MKINAGCGTDIRSGYTNVDFRGGTGVDVIADLSVLPWPFADSSAEEMLLLDFLEHFSYRQTDDILTETWRVLLPGGKLILQVPDFGHCAHAASMEPPFMCNKCGWEFNDGDGLHIKRCGRCEKPLTEIADEAIFRLYGGQDYPGNWHYTAFTQERLCRLLKKNGFEQVSPLHLNQNGESYYQNWNIALEARKALSVW